MEPVARELARNRGILEPIQTATSLEGQVGELRRVLESYGEPPVVLIGFSWGAWLSFIVAARYPRLAKKLFLIGSGPFEERYVEELHETRMSRLSKAEREAFYSVVRSLEDPATRDKDSDLVRLGALAGKADTYDPISKSSEGVDTIGPRADIFEGVWQEAAGLRRRGELLKLGREITCPVVAIHGDHDPHPAEGVKKPLEAVLGRFRFVLLEHCGHKPWIERKARDEFFRVLEQEIG